jgi:hypothetical protein
LKQYDTVFMVNANTGQAAFCDLNEDGVAMRSMCNSRQRNDRRDCLRIRRLERERGLRHWRPVADDQSGTGSGVPYRSVMTTNER